MKYITSVRNMGLQHLLKLLSQAKARRRYGQTVLEGVHLLQMYLQQGCLPVQVYIPESKKHTPEVASLLLRLPENLLTVVATGVLAKISALDNAEEVMTLIDIPIRKALPDKGDCVVLERVQNPGNVGTIMRSAAAAGIGQFILDCGSADVWSPKVLRAGMGAHFQLDVFERTDLQQWQAGYTDGVFTTGLSRACGSLYETDLTASCAWVFGNEGTGVSTVLAEKAHFCVKIPMMRQAESLNVAMAATVCLFEQQRQRLVS